jgi:GGDEF domain-containing protein
MRTFWVLACLVCSTLLAQPCAAQAANAAVAAVAAPSSQINLQTPVEAWSLAPATATVQQIAAGTAGSFKPFNPDVQQDMSWEQPLWLRFRVTANVPTTGTAWTLVLSKPFIDRAEFYALRPDGTWQMQAAGDWIAHRQWPQRSLNPQFFLPALNAGTHDFYVRVFNLVPLHFAMQVLPAEAATAQMHETFLLAALLLGVVALMLLLSTALALVHREPAYAWYALYVLVCLVTMASFLGIGNYALWPTTTWWPEESTTVLAMVVMVAQLQFCRAMFLPQFAGRKLRRYSAMALWASAVALAAYAAFEVPTLQIALSVGVMLLCAGLMVAIVLKALRRGNAVAWLWLVAYAPLLLVVALTVVDTFGWVALPWLPYNAPLYALIFEMPVLLIALHLHAKRQHMLAAGGAAQPHVDPYTGLRMPRLSPQALEYLWSQEQPKGRDMAVAYVDALHEAGLMAKLDVARARRTLLRSARLLRTVLREQDTIALAEQQRFVVIMPNMGLNENLANRLARLVALGYMTDPDDPQDAPVQFRVVVSSKKNFAASWPEVDSAMQRKLSHEEGWGRRSIRYVSVLSSGKESSSPAETETETLSQLWERAYTESTRLPGQASGSASRY